MREHDQNDDFHDLELPLLDAVQATTTVTLPADALERVKRRAKQLDGPSPQVRTTDSGSSKAISSRSRVSALAVAVAMIVAIVGGLFWMTPVGNRAFATVIENVRNAESLQFKFRYQFDFSPAVNGSMRIRGNQQRIEQFDGDLISIADFDRKEALFLDRQRKLVQELKLSEAVAESFENPIQQLRKLTSQDAEAIGEELLDGKKTNLYRLSKVNLLGMTGDAEMLVWVDPVRQLPVKIEIRNTDPQQKMEFTYDRFEWNAQLDETLFSLNIPEGFKRGDVVLDPAPALSKPSSEPHPSTFAKNGVLSHDRVPARIVWDADNRITALLRDAESVPVTQSQPHQLRQWDAKSGKLLWSQSVHGAGTLAMNRDGSKLATVIGREIQLRDITTGQVTDSWGTDHGLISLAISADGAMLAGGIGEWGKGGSPEAGGVVLWNVAQQRVLRMVGDAAEVTRSVRFSPDGSLLASASSSAIKLFEAQTGKLLRVFPGHSRLAFSPDGKSLACVGSSSSKNAATIDLYDSERGKLIRSLTTQAGESTSTILSIQFSPDGQLLTAGDWNGTVSLWTVKDGKLNSLPTQQGGVHAVAFSPDGDRLAIGTEANTLRVLEVPISIVR